jgi:hypothetical protein
MREHKIASSVDRSPRLSSRTANNLARSFGLIVLTMATCLFTSTGIAHAVAYVYQLTGTDISLYQASGQGPASPTSPVATLRLTIGLINPLVYPDSPYDYGPTRSSVWLEGSNIEILKPTTFEYNPGFPHAYPASMRLGNALNFGQCCYDAADAGAFDVAGYLAPGYNTDPIDYTSFSPVLVAFTDVYDNIFWVNKWTISEETLSSSAAPEPAAWVLLVLGFGGIGWALRRAAGRQEGEGGAPTPAFGAYPTIAASISPSLSLPK